MKFHVVLQICTFCKTLLTVRALMIGPVSRPILPIMYSFNMRIELSISGETFLALLALVRFLITVSCQMVFQM